MLGLVYHHVIHTVLIQHTCTNTHTQTTVLFTILPWTLLLSTCVSVCRRERDSITAMHMFVTFNFFLCVFPVLLIKNTVWWSDLGGLVIYCNICMCVLQDVVSYRAWWIIYFWFLASLISSSIIPCVLYIMIKCYYFSDEKIDWTKN